LSFFLTVTRRGISGPEVFSRKIYEHPEQKIEQMKHTDYLKKAIEIAENFSKKGNNGPFGAIVVLKNKIIGEGWNQVVELNDPTAHAEIMAIRKACKTLGTYNLKNAILYTSCEPCPMCLSSIYWAHIEKVYYAASGSDASKMGFDDAFIYKEVCKSMHRRKIPFIQELQDEAIKVFEEWKNNPHKIMY